jgi:hypothetical protein
MKIDLEHQYHGAAIIQIAESQWFTTINAIKRKDGATYRSAYRVNGKIAVFLKYANTRPKGKFKQVQFTFPKKTLKELRELKARGLRVFLGLVCVRARAICCLPLNEFLALLSERKEAAGKGEAQYTLHVGVPKRGQFRVSLAYPNSRGYVAGDELLVPRNDFPWRIFQ